MTNVEKTLEVEQTEKQEVESIGERTRPGPAFVPKVDIYEAANNVHIVCDMPGVAPEAVEVTLEKNVLSLDGYVTPQHPEGYTLTYAEYRVGDYHRQFTLSNEVDQDNISATMRDGILSLTLPKATPTTRQIAVSVG